MTLESLTEIVISTQTSLVAAGAARMRHDLEMGDLRRQISALEKRQKEMADNLAWYRERTEALEAKLSAIDAGEPRTPNDIGSTSGPTCGNTGDGSRNEQH